AWAMSVVPSIRAEMPTPLPPPVTVIVADGLTFMYSSASFWERGSTASAPLIFCALAVATPVSRMAVASMNFFMVFIFFDIPVNVVVSELVLQSEGEHVVLQVGGETVERRARFVAYDVVVGGELQPLHDVPRGTEAESRAHRVG